MSASSQELAAHRRQIQERMATDRAQLRADLARQALDERTRATGRHALLRFLRKRGALMAVALVSAAVMRARITPVAKVRWLSVLKRVAGVSRRAQRVNP